jgi:hypothetical protein
MSVISNTATGRPRHVRSFETSQGSGRFGVCLRRGRLVDVIDEFAKDYLHDVLRWARTGVVGKLDGLSEYDVRRPWTRTGTNLLGLVKHLTLGEARYFGAVFDRPYPDPIPTFDDPGFDNRDHMWVTERESRMDVIASYQRACEHADATIEALPIDATGYVPWWPRPNVKLFNVMVHVVTETNRHLGHADILREQLDGALGSDPTPLSAQEETDWATHRARVENAAQATRNQH